MYIGVTFQGFVISDWQGIDRITYPPHANYTYSVQASILAGVDMVSFITQLKISLRLVHGPQKFLVTLSACNYSYILYHWKALCSQTKIDLLILYKFHY